MKAGRGWLRGWVSLLGLLMFQASMWPLVSPWAMDINTDPGCSRTIDPDMFLSRSPGPNVTMDPGGNE